MANIVVGLIALGAQGFVVPSTSTALTRQYATTQSMPETTLSVLRQATEACEKESCDMAELESLKATLSERADELKKQIYYFEDDCDLEGIYLDPSPDNMCSGDNAELRALTKYITELRDLQSSVDAQLAVLASRLDTLA